MPEAAAERAPGPRPPRHLRRSLRDRPARFAAARARPAQRRSRRHRNEPGLHRGPFGLSWLRLSPIFRAIQTVYGIDDAKTQGPSVFDGALRDPMASRRSEARRQFRPCPNDASDSGSIGQCRWQDCTPVGSPPATIYDASDLTRLLEELVHCPRKRIPSGNCRPFELCNRVTNDLRRHQIWVKERYLKIS